MNLSNLNLTELRDLEEQVRRDIKKREADEIIRAREAILSIAEKLGVPLKDILGAQGKVKGAKGAKSVKGAMIYMHPDDSTLGWSGRGRQPGWVKQWLESGKPLEDLRA